MSRRSVACVPASVQLQIQNCKTSTPRVLWETPLLKVGVSASSIKTTTRSLALSASAAACLTRQATPSPPLPPFASGGSAQKNNRLAPGHSRRSFSCKAARTSAVPESRHVPLEFPMTVALTREAASGGLVTGREKQGRRMRRRGLPGRQTPAFCAMQDRKSAESSARSFQGRIHSVPEHDLPMPPPTPANSSSAGKLCSEGPLRDSGAAALL
jgi:hypothetical protein